MKRILLFTLIISISNICQAQPGSTCGNPLTVGALPYTNTGLTTCGFGDDYSSADACGSSYMNGDDFIFEYTATFTGTIQANVTNTSESGGGSPWPGLFILDGCPTAMGAACLAQDDAISGSLSATASVNSGDSYFIIISSFPSPQCIDFDFELREGPTAGLTCYNETSPAYNFYGAMGTSISFPDDAFSSVQNVDFNFCYMGAEYTQYTINSNGYISFDLSLASTTFTDYTPEALPTTNSDVINSILGPWHDIDPDAGGNVRQRLQGTAPNRRKVITFDNVPLFSSSCSTEPNQSHEIVIYETSNIIDINIDTKTSCAANTDNGDAVLGLNGPLGQNAVPAGGKNNTAWSSSSETIRFTPSCDVCPATLGSEHYSYFDARNIGSKNEIMWGVKSDEEQSYMYEVQRSIDAVNYKTIATRKAVNEEGEIQYLYIDSKPEFGDNYYRVLLKKSEDDFEITRFKNAEVELKDKAKIYPNPVIDILNIDFKNIEENNSIYVELMDLTGKLVVNEEFEISKGYNSIKIDVSKLDKGVYLYNTLINGNLETGKLFVK